jgi:glucose/arabinose dehydrogenase
MSKPARNAGTLLHFLQRKRHPTLKLAYVQLSSKSIRWSRIGAALVLAAVLCTLAFRQEVAASHAPAAATQAEPDATWKSDWAVREGFALDIDTEGYAFPSALAFVPQPGTRPQDPLYFVLELRGRIKVVTNDRQVHTFAEDFVQLRPKQELPAVEGEVGLAGICLAPEQGYVFATFAYQDAEGVLRNNIVRFDSAPRTFSLRPTGQTDLGQILASYEAVPSHQIGGCQVSDGLLYVSVGDGRQTAQSQKVDSALGKILRMTLDGKPAPGNPFRQNDDIIRAANYVWAYGFRNPFGLQVVDGRIFVADNGSGVDRFLQVEPGANYLWDGSDWSIGTNADLVLSPAVGPAEMAYLLSGAPGFPGDMASQFFVALSAPKHAGILQIAYNLEESRVTQAPRDFVRYEGKGTQYVVGVAVGPDGLYFAPIFPDAQGRSAVFRLAFDPAREHPFLLTNKSDAYSLMEEKNCLGCHRLNGTGGAAGPALDRRTMLPHVQERLNSPEYLASVAAIDQLDREPFRSYKAARAEVVAAQGMDRVRTWMTYHIMEPRFDTPDTGMPNLGLTKTEARSLTDYLLTEESFAERGRAALLALLPSPLLPRHLLFAFAAGLLAGLAALALWLTAHVRRASKHGS